MSDTPDRQRKPPIFHERRTYRRRRLMEAARLAPVLGVFLCLVPIFWPQVGEGRVDASSVLIYVFAVWVGLIGLNFALAWALGHVTERDADAEP